MWKLSKSIVDEIKHAYENLSEESISFINDNL